MLHISHQIQLDEREFDLQFIRASGPGGQNVNKVATAVQLRFDVKNTTALPEAVRMRLMKLVGNQLNSAGEIVITAQRHRTQGRNRQDAIKRLVKLYGM